jgi:hypothetical protein
MNIFSVYLFVVFLDDTVPAAYSYKIKVEDGCAHQSGEDKEKVGVTCFSWQTK